MAKCFVCGKEIEENGDELQFCSGETTLYFYFVMVYDHKENKNRK